MIAGELENAFDNGYGYDNFSLFGKKKQKNEKNASAKPKANIGQIIKKAGQKIDDSGGLEGIGKTLDNIRSVFKPANAATTPDTDYEIGVPKQTTEDESRAKKEKEKTLIITAGVIVGGILIIGGVLWYVSSQKNAAQAALSLNKN